MALSGGAANGAWEAGVLWGLLNYGDSPEDYQWDVLSGISVGSWNSIFIGGWPLGTEMEMVDWLQDLWNNTYTSNITVPLSGSKLTKPA